jgi:hypothetical protein
MLLGVTALSLFVAILSPSTAGAKPQVEVEAVLLAAAKAFLKTQYSSPNSAFLELILPIGYYYIAPEPSISSQTLYDVVYQPPSGLGSDRCNAAAVRQHTNQQHISVRYHRNLEGRHLSRRQ